MKVCKHCILKQTIMLVYKCKGCAFTLAACKAILSSKCVAVSPPMYQSWARHKPDWKYQVDHLIFIIIYAYQNRHFNSIHPISNHPLAFCSLWCNGNVKVWVTATDHGHWSLQWFYIKVPVLNIQLNTDKDFSCITWL